MARPLQNTPPKPGDPDYAALVDAATTADTIDWLHDYTLPWRAALEDVCKERSLNRGRLFFMHWVLFTYSRVRPEEGVAEAIRAAAEFP